MLCEQNSQRSKIELRGTHGEQVYQSLGVPDFDVGWSRSWRLIDQEISMVNTRICLLDSFCDSPQDISFPILPPAFLRVEISIPISQHQCTRSQHNNSIRETDLSFAHSMNIYAATNGGATYKTCPLVRRTVRMIAPSFQKCRCQVKRLLASL